MEQWKALHEQGERSPLHELEKRGGGQQKEEEKGKGKKAEGGRKKEGPVDPTDCINGVCGGSSGSSGDEDEDERRRKVREEKEQGRRQSWARGAATMNHAEVRLMMDMMKQAKLQLPPPPPPPPSHDNSDGALSTTQPG